MHGEVIQGWHVQQCGLHAGDYLIDAATGNIIRLDMAFTPSGQWTFQRIYEARPFGRLAFLTTSPLAAPAKPLERLQIEMGLLVDAASNSRIRFANNRPKYFLGDLDHGTARVQMAGIWIVLPTEMQQAADGTWRPT